MQQRHAAMGHSQPKRHAGQVKACLHWEYVALIFVQVLRFQTVRCLTLVRHLQKTRCWKWVHLKGCAHPCQIHLLRCAQATHFPKVNGANLHFRGYNSLIPIARRVLVSKALALGTALTSNAGSNSEWRKNPSFRGHNSLEHMFIPKSLETIALSKVLISDLGFAVFFSCLRITHSSFGSCGCASAW